VGAVVIQTYIDYRMAMVNTAEERTVADFNWQQLERHFHKTERDGETSFRTYAPFWRKG